MPASQGRIKEWHPRPDFQRRVPIQAGPVRKILVNTEAQLFDFVYNDANLTEVEVYSCHKAKEGVAADYAAKLFALYSVSCEEPGQKLDADILLATYKDIEQAAQRFDDCLPPSESLTYA